MATLVYSMMISLGEMISHLPVAGGHLALAGRFIDPAFGLAVGWTYTANWLLVFPTELSAAAVLVSFWSDANPAGWIAICYVLVVLTNFGGPRVYGEVEYVAAVIKVSLSSRSRECVHLTSRLTDPDNRRAAPRRSRHHVGRGPGLRSDRLFVLENSRHIQYTIPRDLPANSCRILRVLGVLDSICLRFHRFRDRVARCRRYTLSVLLFVL